MIVVLIIVDGDWETWMLTVMIGIPIELNLRNLLIMS